jgi:hypothetical protein
LIVLQVNSVEQIRWRNQPVGTFYARLDADFDPVDERYFFRSFF